MGPSSLGPRALRVITYTPALVLGASAAFVLSPATRDAALWALAEDRPVEALTFIALLGASVLAVRLAWRHKGGYPWVSVAYVLFAAASFLIAMEEVSWGQRWLGVETPESFRGINRQGELTLHNIGALQGSSEWMRLLAGLAGLFAVAARRIPALIRVSDDRHNRRHGDSCRLASCGLVSRGGRRATRGRSLLALVHHRDDRT